MFDSRAEALRELAKINTCTPAGAISVVARAVQLALQEGSITERAFALEQAVAANPNATAVVIARDAEVFLKFLNGEPKED